MVTSRGLARLALERPALLRTCLMTIAKAALLRQKSPFTERSQGQRHFDKISHGPLTRRMSLTAAMQHCSLAFAVTIWLNDNLAPANGA